MLSSTPGKITQSLVFVLAIVVTACSPGPDEPEAIAKPMESEPVVAEPTAKHAKNSGANVPANPLKKAYFGAMHIHTSYSFDAYTNGTITAPDDAYRWAKGEAIPGGGGGGDLQIDKPLDWYAVSDHAEYLGIFKKMEDPNSPFSKLDIAEGITSDDPKTAFDTFSRVLNELSTGRSDPDLTDPETSKSIWQEVVATADVHYQPGKFTTFAGFEWTSNPDKRNLHRVVMFENTDNIPDLPFSTLDSDQPEALWKWMDTTRASGAELFAIPHNGNASDGLMFPETESYAGSALTKEYADKRMRNEPVYEITQIKGTSETHPDLSPNDEFSGFEIWDYTLSTDAKPPSHRVGSYLRDALKRGMLLQSEGKGNPFKYGLIGDSDTHNAAATPEEDNYSGKFAIENNPEHRLNGPAGLKEANAKQLREFSSGGLAGVWAEANTREAIFDAIARKETFATSGPRMQLRFFGGFEFAADAMQSAQWLEQAYANGVTMGGDLQVGADKAPTFLVQAMKEADGANLDRIQLIKGWVEDGRTFEKIYDIALSGDRKVHTSGKVPPVGNTVDARSASYTNTIGDPQLTAAWSDPDFDPALPAFYYVRVLQIPTPRWSTYDAHTLGIPPRDDLPVSIRERAWSSPIWYMPKL